VLKERAARFLLMGELSLDSGIKPDQGVLPLAAAARSWDLDGLSSPSTPKRGRCWNTLI